MSQAVKAVIAEDEPILRAHLKTMLKAAWPELDIAGQAANGEEALTLIEAFQPHVVFLDINMPGMSGLDVSQALCEISEPPYIVFITAYDEYAVAAFENQAIDYLLKPVEENRLEQSLARIRKMLCTHSPNLAQQTQINSLLSELHEQTKPKPKASYLRWLKASKSNQIYVIDINDVSYFIADNKYTEISTSTDKYLIKTAISTLEKTLDPNAFWRIHRNCIVKVKHIQRVVKDELGHVYVELKNSTEILAVSRKYHHLFKQM